MVGAMRRTLPGFLILAAAAVDAAAQDVVIRRAESTERVRMENEEFILTMPAGSVRKSLAGTWITRSSGQPVEFSFRPFSDTGLEIAYEAEGKVEDGFGNGETPGWSQYVGFKQRPAIVAHATEKTSFELAVEDQTRFDRTSNVETLRKTELVGKNTSVPGLTFSATAGQSENNDFTSTIRDQSYGRIWGEQQLPAMPVKVSMAPYVAREETRNVSDSERLITGWDSALTLKVVDPTALSLGTNQSHGTNSTTAYETSWSSYYTQVEQALAEGTSVKLRAGYERFAENDTLMNDAVILGAESSFSLTDTITGGVQLRHRAVEFMHEAGTALPETVFSLSIGGSF